MISHRGYTPIGNFEVLVHFTQRTIFGGSTDYLATYYFDFKENKWFGPFEITADGNLITGVTGKPVIIQSDFGNFEMVVPQGDTLQHYWRDNTDGGQPWQYANHPWHKGFEIVSPGNIIGIHKPHLDKVAFFQSKRFRSGPGNHGNFEVMVHFTEQSAFGGGTVDSLYTYTLNWDSMKWTSEQVVADGTNVSGVTGRPVYIQSDVGNYELIVQQGNRLAHYWRDNTVANHPWHKGLPDIPLPTSSTTLKPVADSVSFFQSKVFRSGSGSLGNFEVLVHFTMSGVVGPGGGIVPGPTDFLATYSIDWSTAKWVGPTVVDLNGNALSGVSPF
jgi:hypothetical protein